MIWRTLQIIIFPLSIPLFFTCFFQPIQANAQCVTPIATFPYQEDFEVSPGGWTSGGNGDDWAWGMPNKPTVN
ncbi:MAG: hypothetical protein IPH31_19775 [Lewinellaceae bacterium]|nr:hypothetical protein [Lewinellaceae bacterium]